MGAASSVADATVSAKNNGQGGHVKVANADYVIESLKLSNQHLIASLQRMLNVRHFEEQCQKAFRGNKVGGYLHLYIGQEAVSLGVVDSCKPGDQFLSSYRDHAHCLFLGSDPGAVMSEIFGKATGVSRGKGGSMHLFDKAHGFAGGFEIPGHRQHLRLLYWRRRYELGCLSRVPQHGGALQASRAVPP
jgi:pyruvate dehydrogenase E1 component alpha subunit